MERVWQTLIVDSDDTWRSRLVKSFDGDPAFHVAAEFASDESAIRWMNDESADLLLLDVDGPVDTLFSLLIRRRRQVRPVVMILTSRRDQAARAFEIEAADFLLKPFDEDRLRTAISRAKRALRMRSVYDRGRRVLSMLEDVYGESTDNRNAAPPAAQPQVPRPGQTDPARNGYLKRFVIREVGRISFVNVDDVNWMRSAGNYLELHARDGTHLLRDTLVHLEVQLDPERFVRISRSSMVNMECVRELKPESSGGYKVLLRDGTFLKLSRRFRENMESVLEQHR